MPVKAPSKQRKTAFSPDLDRAYDQVVQHLSINFTDGERLPPIRELAKTLGIGHGTANRVTRQLADDGLLVSRRGLGTYISANLAKHLGELAGRHIRVICSPNADPMVTRLAQSVVSMLGGQGATADSGYFVHKDAGYILGRISSDDDAVMILNPNSGPNLDLPDVPCVFVHTGARVPVNEPCIYDEVTVDQFSSSSLAGSAMRQARVKSVCFVGVRDVYGGRRFSDVSLQRLQGFEEGFGAKIPDENIILTKSYGESWGARQVAGYLQMSPRPEAVFAASDELAVGFIKGALAHDLEPGKDYQIVGFDGQQRGREFPEGPLTTIQVPIEEMAQRGVELLIQRFKDRSAPTRRMQLGCRLFEGSTVRNVNS